MLDTAFNEITFLKTRLNTIEELLSIKQLQINSLLEITKSVNRNMPFEALLRIYENMLHAQIGVRKLAVFMKSEKDEWICVSRQEVDEKIMGIDVEKLLLPFNLIQHLPNTQIAELAEFETLVPVYHKSLPIGYVLLGKFEAEYQINFEEKLKFIQTITNILLAANENKRLARSQTEQLLMQQELKLAAQMQNLLVPSSLPKNEFIEASAFYKPHKNIGGDYYDFLQISDNEIAFCICDISGKGVAAALLMANFQANLRSLINKKYPLDQLVDMLNFKVGEITKGEKYITLFIGTFDFETRILQYVNAGHNPSILFEDGNVRLLETGCTILGMFDTLPKIEVSEMVIGSGAIIINYTDGLTESENKRGEMYDTTGIINYRNKNKGVDIHKFNSGLLEDVIRFKEHDEFDDDITLLSIHIK